MDIFPDPSTRRRLTRLISLWVLLCGLSWAPCLSTLRAQQFDLKQEGDTIVVHLDGNLFTQYHTQDTPFPYLWPIMGPGEIEMTRAFPMRDDEGESIDHLHHRSVWFAHGAVNGIDFWHAANKSGRIEHRRFVKMGDANDPFFIAQSDWVDHDGERQCSDVRVIRFGTTGSARWIDFDISIVADADLPVKFGDTKEGTFAIRVAPTIKAEAGGEIISNNDVRNEDVWGQTGAWVDYHGSVRDKMVGIAVLNHPDSFRFPTYWHVRTYGLFAANVFGLRAFRNTPTEDGSVTLQPGESMTFYYRVLLHEGNQEVGNVRETFINYAKVDKSVTPLARLQELDATPPPAPATEIEIQPQTAALRMKDEG